MLVYPLSLQYTWGPVLWTIVRGQPMLYEKEDVANAIFPRNVLM